MGEMGIVGVVLLALTYCYWASFSPGPSAQAYWSTWDGMGLEFHHQMPLAGLQAGPHLPGYHCMTVSEVFYLLSSLPLLLCPPFLTVSPDILLFSS